MDTGKRFSLGTVRSVRTHSAGHTTICRLVDILNSKTEGIVKGGKVLLILGSS